MINFASAAVVFINFTFWSVSSSTVVNKSISDLKTTFFQVRRNIDRQSITKGVLKCIKEFYAPVVNFFGVKYFPKNGSLANSFCSTNAKNLQ